jgi:hypothetical protein
MSKPLALDLFCCSGGATRGLQRAGFRVFGVDKVKRPNYCGDEFIYSDALAVLRELIGQIRLGWTVGPALINAGPPCQKASTLTTGTNGSKGWGHQAGKDQMIPELRELLIATGIPYIIEQPIGGHKLLRDPIMLCMDMFPIGEPPWVQRHRYFELGGWSAVAPKHPKHKGPVRGYRGRHGDVPGYYTDGDYVSAYGEGGGKATVPEMQHALGIDWTDVREELTEAIPPAYYEWLGTQFLKGRS